MPLPIKRIRKTTVDNALSALILTSEVTKEIADVMQFPPAQAAAGVLLLVFETIQKIQSNREGCYRLARRCLSMLVDIRDHMSGRWDTAPPSLLKAVSKFEACLESIHKFMQQEAEQKWGSRLIRKNAIETAMKQHHVDLDDAARSFQIATLINIHLAVEDSSSQAKTPEATSSPSGTPSGEEVTREATLPPYPLEQQVVISDVQALCTSPIPESTTTDSFSNIDTMSAISSLSGEYELITSDVGEEELRITEHHGFNQYHQSQFRMKGKSRIKSGWWAGGIEGDIDGRKSLMLQYDGDRVHAMKHWMRDVKMLQNLYHPNLPQMVGYSNEETPTPFILLANVQTRLPQALLLDAIKNSSLAECAKILLRFYQDTLDAALYIQRQRNLTDNKLQDYVEHADFRIDAEQTVVMGLPPPEIDRMHSFRNFGLAESIRGIYLRLLPNRGYAREPLDTAEETTTLERRLKINHLAVLARALLPDSDNLDVVKQRLQNVLSVTEDDDDEEAGEIELTLRQIRKAAFAAGAHQQAWFKNTVPPHKFAVGDLGYMPEGSSDWADFVVCCNILKDLHATIETTAATTGRQGMWTNRTYERQTLAPFELPGDIQGWPVVVPAESEFDMYIVHENMTARVNQAWDYLLDSGRALAKQHGVKPENLILVTRVGTEQRFKVRDLRQIQYYSAAMGMHRQPMHQMHHPAHFQRQPYTPPSFGHNPFGGTTYSNGMPRVPIPYQDLTPKVFYLFTSGDKKFQSRFSLTPMPTLLAEGEDPPRLDPNSAKCFAYMTDVFGFLDYVQLHAEDFAV
ncbi:hypothetical protein C8Q77DRAFT_1263022 [Trametes polyzona]|nr:hypothetical protein C8Q77DRAFT_1263022 [Trametes polyzona]